MKPDDLLARLLYRDSLMLIIDKPSGLPVHGGPKGGDNLERHFDPLRFGLPKPPALAHRLDRDTSGCLILGRHTKALRKLGKLFAEGRIEKTYWAVVGNAPVETSGTIDLPLKKLTPKGGWKMTAAPNDPDARPAVTDWRVLGRAGGLAWLELKPRTGRTHQLRVHLGAIGSPIVGDKVYGASLLGDDAAPLHLHARQVIIPLYPSRAPITITAYPPPHMLTALRACGFDEAPPPVPSGESAPARQEEASKNTAK
ncbi:RluA family pseudouridine synthase [Varunaivibrio sulfuroxidans]|uniref:tRNA pseudouridine32 synthase/23S rRNA pseudouridine746 synthase/23S rRNA pseudouridine1911/1915/1917 synthase n=1 Tax=Varunaivibrio sulfuroxidans TaxID=1773489 RepID=A0A4R3J4A8_9PROT|nr:RNA pseudouridine synthase [Varunaivibrio sulfuroxidans]TCS60147.1 tRNA pseudouridine32 synthase/23S rRNA pseudouridine746 synthase/23S rRNA pseudouridine1911/1915/1917 synthase [Varunaivibrio sulfuroxidans]WES30881.1 RNA pseudouridine synthase [Varunaivibrio sulfuroxidans]